MRSKNEYLDKSKYFYQISLTLENVKNRTPLINSGKKETPKK